MRTPPYLSPTSVALFYQSPEEFYLKYLADNSPPKLPQTQPMAVGSAFDAYVKSYIYEHFYGKKDPAFEFQTIFESQVEKQNRDAAINDGKYCFECYKKYGALADLMLELDAASDAPRMEFKVEGRLSHDSCVEGVPLSGKPDLYFFTKHGAHVIYDWKVNGYYSNSSQSPAKGYVMVRGAEGEYRGLNAPHKDATIMMDRGIMINVGQTLEQCKEDWANQLSIYGWLLGEPVGGDFIVGIDQLVFGNPGKKCRIATQRCKVGTTYQKEWFEKIAWVWKVVHSGYIFRDMTMEQSLMRQTMLDNQYKAFENVEGDKNEEWFQRQMRQHANF